LPQKRLLNDGPNEVGLIKMPCIKKYGEGCGGSGHGQIDQP